MKLELINHYPETHSVKVLLRLVVGLTNPECSALPFPKQKKKFPHKVYPRKSTIPRSIAFEVLWTHSEFQLSGLSYTLIVQFGRLWGSRKAVDCPFFCFFSSILLSDGFQEIMSSILGISHRSKTEHGIWGSTNSSTQDAGARLSAPCTQHVIVSIEIINKNVCKVLYLKRNLIPHINFQQRLSITK